MRNPTPELIADLESLDWGDARRVFTKYGPRDVYTLAEIDGDFWALWHTSKDAMKAAGVAMARDDGGEGDGWEVSWWIDPASKYAPQAPPALEPGTKVKNILDDEGEGTLDAKGFAILTLRQRKAAMTLFSVFARHRFALDASEMGEGKTYTALTVARTLGLNYAVVCPAHLVTKWTDTACDPFDAEPEFVLSYESLRNGRQQDFLERMTLHRGHRFTWHLVSPLLFIFDEIQVCAGADSLNSLLFEAAITNPHALTLGLSGTAARDPTTMRVLGRAMGFFSHATQWGKWAIANGCRENPWGGLDFTKNRIRAIAYLTNLHRQIYPEHGCRLLKSDSRAEGQAEQLVFVTPVDASGNVEKKLAPFYKAVDDDEDDDATRAEEKGEAVLPLVEATRERQRAELDLVPYVVEQTQEALAEGQSVVTFVTFTGTVGALAAYFPDALLFTGENKKEHREVLRQFQANAKCHIILNLAAGASGIDLHDTSGIHPRYSIILPTYKAEPLLQAIDRTDRKGKLSKSSVELPFLTKPVHARMMKAVQRKIDNLSLLNDGELSDLNLAE